MLSGLYSAATAMNAAAARHEAIARNLAHSGVPGFRRQVVVTQTFESALDAAQIPTQPMELWGVATFETVTDFGQGPLQRTEQPLDVAIDGEGFFVLEGPDGPLYTRNGAFQRSTTGELVSAEGLRVQGEGGPILIPPEVPLSNITIGADGTVQAAGTEVGRIQIVQFADPAQLRSAGPTVFSGEGLSTEPAAGRIVQGARELANVSAVEELIAMLVGMRHYEAAQRALRTISESVAQNTNPQSG